MDLFPKIRIKQAKQLPIPLATPEIQASIASLVDRIIETKRGNISSETLEKEIDGIVYSLYGLTKAEIKIVEESV